MFVPQPYDAMPRKRPLPLLARSRAAIDSANLFGLVGSIDPSRGGGKSRTASRGLARAQNLNAPVDAAARSRLKKRPGGMQVCGVVRLSLSLARIVPFHLCLAPAPPASTWPFHSLSLSLSRALARARARSPYLSSSRTSTMPGDGDKVAVYGRRRYLRADTGVSRRQRRRVPRKAPILARSSRCRMARFAGGEAERRLELERSKARSTSSAPRESEALAK